MSVSDFIVPILILGVLIYGCVKKVNAYQCFIKGSKDSINLIVDIFPYLIAIFIAIELMNLSGLTSVLIIILTPLFSLCGIPCELAELLVIRPFTSSGSLVILENIFNTYGVDSYIGRCASVIVGCSESIFYVATIYVSATNIKKLPLALPIALFATYISIVFACLLCKIM